MKLRTKIRNKLMDQRGFAFVEATIVFPVMFFVLFFIIFIGNVYYQIAQVDDCVMRAAIRGSQYISNPQQYDMITYGTFPVVIKDVEPYRYIFGEVPGGSIEKIEKIVSEEVVAGIKNNQSFFVKMKPKIKTKTEEIAEFNNYVVYSTFSVDLEYEVTFPIRFIGEKDFWVLKLSSCAEVSTNDTDEFIRNVDMVVDFAGSTKLGKSIGATFKKVTDFIDKFAAK